MKFNLLLLVLCSSVFCILSSCRQKNDIEFFFFGDRPTEFDEKVYLAEWHIKQIQKSIEFNKLKSVKSANELRRVLERLTVQKNVSFGGFVADVSKKGVPYFRGSLMYSKKGDRIPFHVIVTLKEDKSLMGLWVMPGNAEGATAVYVRIFGEGAFNGTSDLEAI
jgi:hypothetical protein